MKLTKAEIKKIIDYEVVVDCYDEHEFMMGWAIYMEDNINYPFEAEYLVKKRSGEKYWQKVIVVNNESDELDFNIEAYYVEIELDEMLFSARLDELRNIKADEETMRTLEVWKYRNI